LVWRSFLDALVGTLIFLFQRNHFLEEAHSQECRLASLPGKHDFVAGLAFDVLPNVGFQNLVADAEFAVATQQFFFVQVIAVGAVEIADRSRRLHHGVKSRLRARINRRWRQGIGGVAHGAFQSEEKIRFHSFIMLMTVPALASSHKAWVKVPTCLSGAPWAGPYAYSRQR
jgi:hypothetical protein